MLSPELEIEQCLLGNLDPGCCVLGSLFLCCLGIRGTAGYHGLPIEFCRSLLYRYCFDSFDWMCYVLPLNTLTVYMFASVVVLYVPLKKSDKICYGMWGSFTLYVHGSITSNSGKCEGVTSG